VRLGVAGRDRGLQDVRTRRAVGLLGPEQRRETAPDQQLVPAAAVLLRQRDRQAVRVQLGRYPGRLNLHQRGQAVHLWLGRHQLSQHAAQSQRLMT
jgi:hypothetical protein